MLDGDHEGRQVLEREADAKELLNIPGREVLEQALQSTPPVSINSIPGKKMNEESENKATNKERTGDEAGGGNPWYLDPAHGTASTCKGEAAHRQAELRLSHRGGVYLLYLPHAQRRLNVDVAVVGPRTLQASVERIDMDPPQARI